MTVLETSAAAQNKVRTGDRRRLTDVGDPGPGCRLHYIIAPGRSNGEILDARDNSQGMSSEFVRAERGCVLMTGEGAA